MEDFLRACHDVVLENHPKSLGPKMSLTHGSLLQRANHENGDHHLTIEHLFGLLLNTHDFRPLKALAESFGFDLVAKELPAPTDLNSALLRLHADLADVTRLAFDAQADGRVCSTEKTSLLKEAEEVIVSLEVFKQSVKAA